MRGTRRAPRGTPDLVKVGGWQLYTEIPLKEAQKQLFGGIIIICFSTVIHNTTTSLLACVIKCFCKKAQFLLASTGLMLHSHKAAVATLRLIPKSYKKDKHPKENANR